MNQIVNKFLLASDKFTPEMHLRQPGFTYSACGPFTRNKQRIQKIMQTGDTSSKKRYQRGLASMVYKFFDMKSNGTGTKNEINENQQLANELHKLIIMKLKERKVYSSFKDNIWVLI